METDRDVLLGVGALVLIIVITSLGAVTLLWRMSPAIERIIEENVVSLEAGEEMIAVLALSGTAVSPREHAARFEAALRRARDNVTEREELPVLEEIQRHSRAGLAGDAVERAAAVAALQRLGAINRQAMVRADERAKRLGRAGAWAGVVLAFLGLMTSLALVQRLRRRLVEPLGELCTVLEAAVQGDRYRRCSPQGAPAEIERAMYHLNEILDQAGARSVLVRPAVSVSGESTTPS